MLKQVIPVLHMTSADATERFYCSRLGFDLEFEVPASATQRDPCYLGVVRDGRPLTVAARLGERGSDDDEGTGTATPAAAPTKKGDALGLVVANLGAASRAELRLPRDRVGVEIREVLGADPGTDALEEGDLVVEVNRKPTPDPAAYRRVVGALAPGEPAWLYVFRPRQRFVFLTRIEVEKRP